MVREVELEVAGLVAVVMEAAWVVATEAESEVETEAELVVEKAEERVEEREEGWEEKEDRYHTDRCGPRHPNRTQQEKKGWC